MGRGGNESGSGAGAPRSQATMPHFADEARAETLATLNRARAAFGLAVLAELPVGERAFLYRSETPVARALQEISPEIRIELHGQRLEITSPLSGYDEAVERVEKIAEAFGVDLRRGPYGVPMGGYGQYRVSHYIPLPESISLFLDHHRRGSHPDLLPINTSGPFAPKEPIKMVITGKMASGKGAASGHLVERYGAQRMPREDIIKPFVYGIAEEDPATSERLAELFPADEQARAELEAEIGDYMKTYVDEGGKRRRLLQDVIDFVQKRNSYAIEEALNDRIQAAAADAPFVIIDDVRPREAFEFFGEKGYVTVRIEASRATCEKRMMARDGVVPPEEAFQHWTETALDGVRHDFVIRNEGDDPAALADELDALVERLVHQQA